MMAQGQWHSVSGFGGHGKNWSNMPGVWHKVASFGGSGKNNNAGNFRRDWQTGGGGWSFGVTVGDLCVNPGVCQGVWQMMPQNGGQPRQSRTFQRDWQVNGEL